VPLTDVQIRKAKAAEKPYRLADGAGLHLFVTQAGGKLWRYRYEFGGKEKLLSLGQYPLIGLAEAREMRDAARKLLIAGKDPGIAKKQHRLTTAQASADTFEVAAREWHGHQVAIWSEVHAEQVMRDFERDVFPDLGEHPLRDITSPMVLATLRKVEQRGARETARRIRQRISGVFVYAIGAGRAENDPAAVVQKAMAPLIKGRQPAITDLDEARDILKKAEETPAHIVTRLALRLLAITAVRPGTLLTTPWAEFAALDPKAPTWTIPASRLKLPKGSKDDQRRDHLVPLARQAVETIDALRKLTGRGPLVLPNTRHAHRPMSENAIGYLLNRAGYHHRHVPHGWRSTFSTVMNERFPADRQVIDLMLAHVPKEKVEAAYNRAAHLQRRRELAQLWADLIMEGRPAAKALLPR
jgi:integrase